MSALSILAMLITGHYLIEPDCGPNQSWQYIEPAGIHACTMDYPAEARRLALNYLAAANHTEEEWQE